MPAFVISDSGRRITVLPPDLVCCGQTMQIKWGMPTSEDLRWAFTCDRCGEKVTAAVEVGRGHTTETRGGT